MNKFLLAVCFILFASAYTKLLQAPQEVHWAVLVAGSNGYWNYRHQSDTCHAYQLLRKNGMPASRIIVLAYNDIANDSENPFPGKVFNKPDPKGKGQDVWKGCALDYQGEDVTPQVFLNVLTGNADANKGKGTGRVLQSTENDKVFIYFTDHGADGLIAFPDEYLYADDLLKALDTMHSKKLYKRLVFYLEACESGSMFEGKLPKDTEIYATTAANPSESSWATYCSPDDKINGKSVGSCLGDEYSVNWLENTEGTASAKLLQKQFEEVRDKTKGSHVQQYGILDWAQQEDIKNFQGDVNAKTVVQRLIDTASQCANELYFLFHPHALKELKEYQAYLDIAKTRLVSSRDVKLYYLRERHNRMKTIYSKKALDDEVSHIEQVDSFFSKFNSSFEIDVLNHKTVEDYNCLKTTMNYIKDTCGKLLSEYSLKYVRNINVACEKSSLANIQDFVKNNC
jgi:legumain